ncbi:MAG: hypothetical protein WCZ23_14970 [Rhodospirillaceae bacterium]
MPGIAFRSFSTTEVNKSGGRVWDEAWQNGGVEITRRDQRFVVMRVDYLEKVIDEARDDRPKTLEDLLAGYDGDKIRRLTHGFMNDKPSGRESL